MVSIVDTTGRGLPIAVRSDIEVLFICISRNRLPSLTAIGEAFTFLGIKWVL
jgi:hypothetical protein